MSDRYAVIGNPVAHSRSPAIHALFAAQTGQDIVYGRLLAPTGGFVAAVERFRDEGGAGLNVTLPFKVDAYRYCARCAPRAQAAGAVNTISFLAGEALGENTDGAGLVRDIEHRVGLALRGARVLLLGAGGAARGVVAPLLDAGIAALAIVNRSEARAVELAAAAGDPRVSGAGYPSLGEADSSPATGARFDLIVNATSSALAHAAPPVPAPVLRGAALAYEMMYGASDTPFMRAARDASVGRVVDGLGMLVEQAAESFSLWRGVRPQTDPVYERIRRELAGA
ncbi:MAG: shikimate dehydrogenase [Burkholderiaceae bacterium]|nr:shikimate dehydrogenase [Burkholderiaceae bacterium]